MIHRLKDGSTGVARILAANLVAQRGTDACVRVRMSTDDGFQLFVRNNGALDRYEFQTLRFSDGLGVEQAAADVLALLGFGETDELLARIQGGKPEVIFVK